MSKKDVEESNTYRNIILHLKAMDTSALIELFHDIDNIETVQRISDASYHFCENYEEPVPEGEHETVDWKRQDDAQRYADYKLTKAGY